MELASASLQIIENMLSNLEMRELEEQEFDIIVDKLDLISRLIAIDVLQDVKTQKDKILLLSTSGFQPTEIASILGTSSNTVNVALSKARKEGDI